MTTTHKTWVLIGTVILVILFVGQCVSPKDRGSEAPFATWSAEQWRLLQKVEFKGEWTPGHECDRGDNFCRFVFTDTRTYIIDRPKKFLCFWPTEEPLQIRVRKPDGSWTGFRDHKSLFNYGPEAIEIRAPNASRDYPYIAYIVAIPRDMIETCERNKIVRAIWEVT